MVDYKHLAFEVLSFLEEGEDLRQACQDFAELSTQFEIDPEVLYAEAKRQLGL